MPILRFAMNGKAHGMQWLLMRKHLVYCSIHPEDGIVVGQPAAIGWRPIHAL